MSEPKDAAQLIVAHAARALAIEECQVKRCQTKIKDTEADLEYQEQYFDLYAEEHDGMASPYEDTKMYDLQTKVTVCRAQLALHRYAAEQAKKFLISLYPVLTKDPFSAYVAALQERLQLLQAKQRDPNVNVLEDIADTQALLLEAQSEKSSFPAPQTVRFPKVNAFFH